MEMREHEEKDRGLLSIKFWYPERRLHFIIINRPDENMGFVISQRHGEDSGMRKTGLAVLLTPQLKGKNFKFPKVSACFHWMLHTRGNVDAWTSR